MRLEELYPTFLATGRGFCEGGNVATSGVRGAVRRSRAQGDVPPLETLEELREAVVVSRHAAATPGVGMPVSRRRRRKNPDNPYISRNNFGSATVLS